MRASGPYEVKPRQLRALVVLLVLLPLVPMAFVVRFLIEAVDNERHEARARARPVYQRLLDATSDSLAAAMAKQLAVDPAPDDPWWIVRNSPGTVDGVLTASAEGRLTAPDPSGDTGRGSLVAEGLARAVVEGVHYATLPPRGAVRWRFLTETPEPIFSLHPSGAARRRAAGESSLLLLKTRQHLMEQITAFYQHEMDPQTTLRLIDESAESSSDVPLAETALHPPLPAWRVQLFTGDETLMSGLAHEQIAFYWWSVAGMLAGTAGIAGAAGWALTRRIALHELGNDALSIVAHEMKTPLASTRLLVDTLLERRYQGGEEGANEYLRLIAGENLRLERLVESFQTLSRLEHSRGGRGTLRLEAVQAGEIVDLARARLANRLEAAGCKFTVEGDLDAPPFTGDREALTAVLVNLLDNALKYSGDEKRIVLRTQDTADRVTFEVSDDGIGIAPEEQGRVFERFYQADNRLSRTHEGCGLGLSIVRSAVQAHGGTVSLQSTPGKGSTFTVAVPRKRRMREKG